MKNCQFTEDTIRDMEERIYNKKPIANNLKIPLKYLTKTPSLCCPTPTSRCPFSLAFLPLFPHSTDFLTAISHAKQYCSAHGLAYFLCSAQQSKTPTMNRMHLFRKRYLNILWGLGKGGSVSYSHASNLSKHNFQMFANV